MTEDIKIRVHPDPVWRKRSNFIIRAQLPTEYHPWRFEQLFARRLSENTFEICCIPFFMYNIALGDVVATTATEDSKYLVTSVVKPSGRYVFRVWFGESLRFARDITEKLEALGSLIEWSSVNLLAVDAIDQDHAQVVADLLAEHERLGHLVYETGRQ